MRTAVGALLALSLTGALLPSMGALGRAQDQAPEGREEDLPPRPEQAAPPAPLRSYTDQQGRMCRVYQRRVIINGEAQTALATVCREANGRWVLSR